MSAGSAGETAWELHGSGPAVVLIHGFGLNRAMWQWQLPALTPHFSVLTYDLLGHGERARPTGTPDLAMFSAQLLGLMDCSGIARAAVVGFSLGGHDRAPLRAGSSGPAFGARDPALAARPQSPPNATRSASASVRRRRRGLRRTWSPRSSAGSRRHSALKSRRRSPLSARGSRVTTRPSIRRYTVCSQRAMRRSPGVWNGSRVRPWS